jgi:hypothetical protein
MMMRRNREARRIMKPKGRKFRVMGEDGESGESWKRDCKRAGLWKEKGNC